LYISDIKRMPVPLPPLAEQVEIRRVESLMTIADAAGGAVLAASDRAGRIPQAILSKAFSGDLVPTEADLARAEARTYEPASMLIERMRGHR
jgi:type I restriction enzyme S subunit